MIGKTLFGAACAAMIMAASGVPSAAFAETSKQFLQNAIQGDNAEIMLGRMAEMKGSSPSVQEFGTTLFDDHSKAKAQTSQVADHRHDIGEFRKEAAAHMGKVSKLAQQQLPTLQKHLDMAVALYNEPKVAEAETR
jgi:putative membrane protein